MIDFIIRTHESRKQMVSNLDILKDVLNVPINLPVVILLAISSLLMATCGVMRLSLGIYQMIRGRKYIRAYISLYLLTTFRMVDKRALYAI